MDAPTVAGYQHQALTRGRAAIAADLEAALSHLSRSATWTSLDQMVTLLLGRGLTQLCSDVASGLLAEADDDDLDVVLALALERISGYYEGQEMSPGELEPEERAALERLWAIVGRRLG